MRLLSALFTCLVAAVAMSAGESVNLRLHLPGALSRDGESRQDLDLELRHVDGRFVESFAWGRGMSQGRHHGTVAQQGERDGKRVLELAVVIEPEPWLPGGKATYAITLDPVGEDGAVAGTYTGTFTLVGGKRRAPARPGKEPESAKLMTEEELAKLPPPIRKRVEKQQAALKRKMAGDAQRGKVLAEIEVEGTVTGRRAPAWPVPVTDHRPLEPGEHPRLIFRRHEVTALRERAKTPVGAAIMARFREIIDYRIHSDNAKFDAWPGIGYGFAYQVTADAAHAERAQQLIQAKFFDRDPLGGQDIHHGPMLQGLALTYDLCCEAWPEDFRKKCVDEIWQRARECHAGMAGGDGTKVMGGTNFAYWSNHNGIRATCAGLGALAILGDAGTAGPIPVEEARLIADTGAWDAYGYIEAAHGGGAYNMEGLHYRGMTFIRGFGHFIQAYEKVTGLAIHRTPNGDMLTLGHHLEAKPGDVFFRPRPWDGMGNTPKLNLDLDSLVEYLWTVGLFTVPPEAMPGVKHLLEEKTKGGTDLYFLDRACYAPYLLANYPFDVEAEPPAERFPWIAPDPVSGHWVFRPAWADGNDVLFTLNHLSAPRRSCHYERVGPLLEWRLFGGGQLWWENAFLPEVVGKPGRGKNVGAETIDWSVDDGKVFRGSFRLDRAFMPPIARQRGDKTPSDVLAQRLGGLAVVKTRLGELADRGVRGTRQMIVDGSGKSGAPLLVAVHDRIGCVASAEGEPRPTAATWRLPLIKASPPATYDGRAFTQAAGGATLRGVVLGGDGWNGSTLTAPTGEILLVFVVGRDPVPEVKVAGEGLAAAVTVGDRKLKLVDGKLVLE